MLTRPWVQPSGVKDYTASDKVKSRSDDQLSYDIARAEKYVIYHTHNKFEEYETLPSDVEMAVILLAESYALKAIAQIEGRKQSETFDDYSYTLDTKTDDIDELGLGPLLDDYVLTQSKGRVTMKLRKL